MFCLTHVWGTNFAFSCTVNFVLIILILELVNYLLSKLNMTILSVLLQPLFRYYNFQARHEHVKYHNLKTLIFGLKQLCIEKTDEKTQIIFLLTFKFDNWLNFTLILQLKSQKWSCLFLFIKRIPLHAGIMSSY